MKAYRVMSRYEYIKVLKNEKIGSIRQNGKNSCPSYITNNNKYKKDVPYVHFFCHKSMASIYGKCFTSFDSMSVMVEFDIPDKLANKYKTKGSYYFKKSNLYFNDEPEILLPAKLFDSKWAVISDVDRQRALSLDEEKE